MEAPDFWNDPERSQQMMKELKSKKDDVEIYNSLVSQMDDIEVMLEMGYEENDPSLIPEIQQMLDEFEQTFEGIRMKTLLSGEYDKNNAIVTLHAGQAARRPAIGQACCTGCIPAGRLRKVMT